MPSGTEILTAVLAPVFLISGVGLLLNTMATRYARVIDRVQDRLARLARCTPGGEDRTYTVWEIEALYHRARVLRATIIAATASIFLVTLVMVLLFARLVVDADVGIAPEATFVAALAALSLSLALFIRDFAISLRTLKEQVRRGLGRPASGEAPPESPVQA